MEFTRSSFLALVARVNALERKVLELESGRHHQLVLDQSRRVVFIVPAFGDEKFFELVDDASPEMPPFVCVEYKSFNDWKDRYLKEGAIMCLVLQPTTRLGDKVGDKFRQITQTFGDENCLLMFVWQVGTSSSTINGAKQQLKKEIGLETKRIVDWFYIPRFRSTPDVEMKDPDRLVKKLLTAIEDLAY